MRNGKEEARENFPDEESGSYQFCSPGKSFTFGSYILLLSWNKQWKGRSNYRIYFKTFYHTYDYIFLLNIIKWISFSYKMANWLPPEKSAFYLFNGSNITSCISTPLHRNIFQCWSQVHSEGIVSSNITYN